MTWVRIDDHFDEHPKHAEAGPLGWALWAAGLAYCNRNLTDGFIPAGIVPTLVNWKYLDPPDAEGRVRKMVICVSCGAQGEDVTSEYVASILTSVGLWETCDGGYKIHDYDDYQPSKKEVIATRKATAKRTRMGGLARAKTAQRESGRYVKHQQLDQQEPQQDTSSTASIAAGEGPCSPHQQPHQQQHQLTTSPVPVPVVQVLSTKSTPDAVADPALRGSSESTKEPAPKPSGKPKALNLVLTKTQAVRAKLLCGAIESLPRKVRGFHPWGFLQKCVAGGLPADEALKILCGMKDRWGVIVDPWAYAAEVLRKEYQQYRIDLAIQEHEQRKREPASIGKILVEAQRKAAAGQEEKPW